VRQEIMSLKNVCRIWARRVSGSDYIWPLPGRPFCIPYSQESGSYKN